MSLLLLCGSLLTYAACQSTHNSPAVDRRDPEAVLRAYFNAWSNNDAATQKSLMTEKYSNLAYEPVDSLRVLTIVPADGASPTKRVYAVSFEVTFKGGRSISMENGRYNWTYTLNWDATRNSWLISNYGAGEEGRLKLRRIFYSSFIPHIIGEATEGNQMRLAKWERLDCQTLSLPLRTQKNCSRPCQATRYRCFRNGSLSCLRPII